MKSHHSRHAFTLIELLVVISIIALLIGILLPALGAARKSARQMANNTQLRGIHQGMFTFAQSNKGWYPGIDSDGQPLTDSGDVSHISDPNATYTTVSNGTHPLRRLAIMLETNFFPPEYILNPADDARDLPDPTADGTVAPGNVNVNNYSYAMLEINNHNVGGGGSGTAWTVGTTWSPSARGQEWQDTANTAAVMMSDRAIADNGTGSANVTAGTIDYHSVWTEQGGGEWSGAVQRNDGSTEFSTTPDGFDTRYTNKPDVQDDNLFTRIEGGTVQNEANAKVVSGSTVNSLSGS